jgi:hypothetical protein
MALRHVCYVCVNSRTSGPLGPAHPTTQAAARSFNKAVTHLLHGCDRIVAVVSPWPHTPAHRGAAFPIAILFIGEGRRIVNAINCLRRLGCAVSVTSDLKTASHHLREGVSYDAVVVAEEQPAEGLKRLTRLQEIEPFWAVSLILVDSEPSQELQQLAVQRHAEFFRRGSGIDRLVGRLEHFARLRQLLVLLSTVTHWLSYIHDIRLDECLFR